MDTFLASLTMHMREWVLHLVGDRGNAIVAGSLTFVDCAIVGGYLLLTLAANTMVALYINRHTKRPRESDPPKEVHRHVIAAIGKPIYILIWIYGIYVAATPLLIKLGPEQGLLWIKTLMDLLFDVGALASFFWFLFRVTRVIEARLALWASVTPGKIDDLLVPLLGTTLRVVVSMVAAILVVPMLGLPVRSAAIVGKLTSIALIGAVALLLFRGVAIAQRVILAQFDMTVADNLRARKIYTQIHVIGRVVYVVIGVFSVAAILMLFDEVRHVGTSLLASAGVVGIIAGFAAQKTLANLFAGFQIALAQPVRQDDVVVVEGEWGRVEEITLSYIVVHIWDDRRLVLPLSYFIEKPFQNWTRTSSALTGSVFIWVDYSFPVEAGRHAVKSIIEGSALWDKRFWNLQVSDAGEHTIQLRVLATSSDSSRSWDLRCEIREKFVDFIQQNYPGALPRLRADIVERPGSKG